MTIADLRDKCKSLTAKVPRDALILAILIVASSVSFGLGYLAGLDVHVPDVACALSQSIETGKFVASKSGTKYYLPTCAAAGRISDANKVWFASTDSARAAGYTPAANCEGI